jgi:biopolymer transport protein ExbD
MGFKTDNQDDESISDINITPFVDVVLVLLVIFMVTTPMMVKDSLKIKLPSSKTSETTSPSTLGITILKNGQVLINGELVADESLLSIFADSYKKDPEVKALIAQDGESLHQDTIKILDLLKQAGIDQFAFQIERIKK